MSLPRYILRGLCFIPVPNRSGFYECRFLEDDNRPKAGDVMSTMYEFMSRVGDAASVHCDYCIREYNGQLYSEVLCIFREVTSKE